MTVPRLAAVLACHNRKATTQACLGRLLGQQAGVDMSVFLVDDGSTDGTAEAVAAQFPDVRIIRADGNRYWAGAMGLGLSVALEQHFDLHLWLNDDVMLDPGALAGLMAVMDQAGPSPIVVGTTRDPVSGARSYGGAVRASAWPPFRFAQVHAVEGPPVSCDTFNGNCVLVPRHAFEVLGPVDPGLDGAQGIGDTDYGLRARQAGIGIVAAPGFVGTCAPNREIPPWRDGRRSLGQRLASIFGARGPASRQMMRFARRHGGDAWPLWFAVPAIKAALGALVPVGQTPDGKLRVALVEGSVPSYRLPFLNLLAETADLDVTIYHGQPAPGGTDDTAPGGNAIRVRNIFLPRGGGRILWTTAVPGILRRGADVVMIAEHVFNLSHWLIWLSRKVLGRPRLVVTGHLRLDKDRPGSLAAMVLPRLRRALVRGADAVAPYTEEGGEQCRRAGIAADRVFSLNNTMDVDAIRDAADTVRPEEIEAARARFGLGDGPVFLFVGRLYPGKRVPLAAEAVARLPGASLLVVGEGGDRKVLEAMRDEGLPVHLAGEERDIRRLAPLFRLSTALVMPDCLGLACVHAFASGLPVVVAPGGGHGVELGYLRHGGNGLMADGMSAEALAAALRRLVDEPDLTARLRQEAHLTASRLGLGRSVETLAAAFRRAVRECDDDART